MIAIVEAYRKGLLKPQNWGRNIIAGLIVGVVALPLAMAFAMAIGVKPEEGLYTAIIAGLIVGVFGGSQIQIAGPTGAFVVILANITSQYGISGLQIATLLAGLILIFMGLMKLGSVIKFIPDPVIQGFTTGIGVIILTSALKDFFGISISMPIDAYFYQKICALTMAIPLLNVPTTLLSILSLCLIIFSPKLFKRIPAPLVALVFGTLFQIYFQFKDIATLGSVFGGIPQHLPHFTLPKIHEFNQIINLIGPAFTIALLGSIESLLSATAADGMSREKHNSNQELIGQGLANILTPLFGGFAATGAIARTATNIRSGGNSPLSSIIHSITLLFIIIFLAPLASYIPLCTLSAILCMVAYTMSDIPHFIHMLKHAPRYDVVLLVVTFLLTIFTDLVIAVNIGVILAMLFFIRRMHQSVTVELQTSERLYPELSSIQMLSLPEDILVYTIQGPFFFGVSEKIERILATINKDPKIIAFRLKEVPFMDMTGLETFKELIEQYHKRNVKIYLCEANPRVIHKLIRMNIIQFIEGKHIFETLTDVFKFYKTHEEPLV